MIKKLKWPLRILAAIVVLLIIAVLVLGSLPIAADVAPRQHKSYVGAPADAPTSPLAQGSPQTFTVKPGDAIQDKVNQAKPGDIVEVMPGTYHEAVVVSTQNITLRGVPGSNGEWPV